MDDTPSDGLFARQLTLRLRAERGSKWVIKSANVVKVATGGRKGVARGRNFGDRPFARQLALGLRIRVSGFTDRVWRVGLLVDTPFANSFFIKSINFARLVHHHRCDGLFARQLALRLRAEGGS